MTPRATAVLAIFIGPAACLADQLCSYVLVYSAAATGDKSWLHLITLIAALTSMLGLLVSYRVLRRKTKVFEVDRFLARVGIAMNALFLLVILAGFGLPNLVLNATD